MKYVNDLYIPQKYITIFGGGESSFNLNEDDYKTLEDSTYTIAINEYFLCKTPLRIDARIWTDYTITKIIKDIWVRTGHKEIWITRNDAFCKAKDTAMITLVNYWYDTRKEGLNTRKYTLLTILELLRKHFPEKEILVFGLDLLIDKRFGYGKVKEGHYSKCPKAPYKTSLHEIKDLIENKDNIFLSKIYNCNPNANVEMQKVNYRSVLNGV